MGFRSDIYIAIKKKVILDPILYGELPEMMKNPQSNEGKDNENIYWFFEGLKWYPNYTEVIEVTEFLDKLNYADYGFIITNEDNTYRTQGNTSYFDMHVDLLVDSPIADVCCYPKDM